MTSNGLSPTLFVYCCSLHEIEEVKVSMITLLRMEDEEGDDGVCDTSALNIQPDKSKVSPPAVIQRSVLPEDHDEL